MDHDIALCYFALKVPERYRHCDLRFTNRLLDVHDCIILFPMFDNIKKIQELKRMQDDMKLEKETVQKRGISVTVNGNMKIENITLSPTLEQRETEEVLKQCVNEAMKNIQKRMAKKMMMSSGLGGF